jgi:hypothetical protein
LAKFVQLTFAADNKSKVWINFDRVQYFHCRANDPEDTTTLIVFASPDDEYSDCMVVKETEEEIYSKLTR